MTTKTKRIVIVMTVNADILKEDIALEVESLLPHSLGANDATVWDSIKDFDLDREEGLFK